MTRAFLALEIPEEVRSALVVQQFFLPMPRKVEREKFHLTLCFLGDGVRDDVLEAVHEGMEALRMPGFALTLTGIGHFGGAKPRAVWAGVERSEALERLQGKVETVARRAGCVVPSQRYVPHVTLGQFSSLPAEDQPRLEQAIVAGVGFRAGPFAVREVVLFAVRGEKVRRYDALARYGLTG